MLRAVRLLESQSLTDLPDRHFPLPQYFQYRYARRMSQRKENLRLQLVDPIQIHISHRVRELGRGLAAVDRLPAERGQGVVRGQ